VLIPKKHQRPSKWYLSIFLTAVVLWAIWLPASAEEPEKTSSPTQNNPIKIGLLISTSGVASDAGKDMLNGLQLYLNQISNKMAGRKVELIVENDESSRATAVSKIKKLIEQDGVDVVVGTILSNIAYAVAPIAENAHVPLLLPVSGADDLTMRKHGNFVLRLSFSSSQVSYPFGEYAFKNLGYKKVVTIGSDYPMAWESIGGFQKTFEQAGGRVIQRIWMPLGFKDFNDYIKEVRQDADAIYVVTPVGAGEIFAKQLKTLRPHLPVIGAGPTFDESVIRHVGDEVIGALNPFIYSCALENPANKRFVKDYQAAYHQLPSHLSEGCYVAGMCINKAVAALHGDVHNKEKFLMDLRKADLKEAPRGPIVLDEYDNPTQNVYIFEVEKQNGHLVNVPIHTFPNVSQFWTVKPADVLKEPSFSREYPPCKYCAPTK
jgi:branched-chain amino acid transport system substrate-binding protein